jgi:hypothetical protein
MEGLRIRIPRLFPCVEDDCFEYAKRPGKRCRDCLLTWMRQEMTTATLTRQAQLIHSPSLRGDPGSRGEIY